MAPFNQEEGEQIQLINSIERFDLNQKTKSKTVWKSDAHLKCSYERKGVYTDTMRLCAVFFCFFCRSRPFCRVIEKNAQKVRSTRVKKANMSCWCTPPKMDNIPTNEPTVHRRNAVAKNKCDNKKSSGGQIGSFSPNARARMALHIWCIEESLARAVCW